MKSFSRFAMAAICMLCMSFNCIFSIAELEVFTMNHGMIYNSNGMAIGRTDEYDEYRTTQEAKGIVFSSVAYPHLSVSRGVVYGQGNIVLGVTEGFIENDLCYWTTYEDRYFHSNSFCDEGSKSPITLEGALLFEKAACPVCVNVIEPMFLGEFDLNWQYDCEPWDERSKTDIASFPQIEASVPGEYKRIATETAERFETRFYDAVAAENQGIVLVQGYPDNYVRHFQNVSGGYTFSMTAPTHEDIAAFSEQFGEGVWIITEKFNRNELWEAETYCQNYFSENQSELRLSDVYIDLSENACIVLLWGEASENDAAARIEEIRGILPLCARVRYSN